MHFSPLLKLLFDPSYITCHQVFQTRNVEYFDKSIHQMCFLCYFLFNGRYEERVAFPPNKGTSLTTPRLGCVIWFHIACVLYHLKDLVCWASGGCERWRIAGS